MTRTAVNPWQWQQKYGFTQAWRVEGVRTLLFVSGQGPVDANGAVVGEGDFEAQVRTVSLPTTPASAPSSSPERSRPPPSSGSADWPFPECKSKSTSSPLSNADVPTSD